MESKEVIYKILKESERAINLKYPYRRKKEDGSISGRSWIEQWVPKYVISEGVEAIEKFLLSKMTERGFKVKGIIFEKSI
jgi:hypothetical protein